MTHCAFTLCNTTNLAKFAALNTLRPSPTPAIPRRLMTLCFGTPFWPSISKAFCNIFAKITIFSKSNLQATAWSDHKIRKKIVIFFDHSDPVKQGIFAKRTHFGSIFLNFPLISSKTHCFKNWSNRSSDLIIDTKLMKHLQFAIFGESMKSSSAVRFQLRNGYFSKLKTLNHLARRPPKPQKSTKNTPC